MLRQQATFVNCTSGEDDSCTLVMEYRGGDVYKPLDNLPEDCADIARRIVRQGFIADKFRRSLVREARD